MWTRTLETEHARGRGRPGASGGSGRQRYTGRVEEGLAGEARETQGQVWVITASGVSTHTVSTPFLMLQGDVGAAQVSEVTLPVPQANLLAFILTNAVPAPSPGAGFCRWLDTLPLL